jgi:hypothetical protein
VRLKPGLIVKSKTTKKYAVVDSCPYMPDTGNLVVYRHIWVEPDGVKMGQVPWAEWEKDFDKNWEDV